MTRRIGIDLDNTLIRYDRAFAVAAAERDLIPAGFRGAKQQLRDRIRALPGLDGETEWQKLQGYVYGTGIMQAQLFDGVGHFLERARAGGSLLHIVSHKTQYGHFDPARVNLRDAAMAFLRSRGLFAFLPEEQVFFAATRQEKCEKIASLGCDLFIDDLEEVFADPAFPPGVRKLLFAAHAPDTIPGVEICPDWAEIEAYSMQQTDSTPGHAARDKDSAVDAVASALLGRKADRVAQAGNGGNSRIYRVEAGGESFALKMYPALAGDLRDRQGVEQKALRFFESGGIGCVPRWLGGCPGYGLLSWVEGALANPPTDAELETSIAFLADIKRLSQAPQAQALPPASEACSGSAEILRQIDRRLSRLQAVAEGEPTLRDFLARAFAPTLMRHRAVSVVMAPREKLCLIPADFGFHNAMRGPGEALAFIDFEYFGWDDPVKLTADFLLHPAMRLTPRQSRRFREAMRGLFADDPAFAARLHALMPLFALRWALILLNEFLPERWAGRAFAQGSGEWAAAKTRQLAKAETMLESKEAFNA